MAPLKVRPTVPPPHLRRSEFKTRRRNPGVLVCRSAQHAHVCQQELSEIVQQSHWDHHGSHSSSHSQAASASEGVLRACGRGTRFEAQKSSAHLLKPTKTPNSLWPREELSLRHPASWVASHQGAGPDLCQPATIFSERRPQEKVSHAQQRRAHGFQRTVKRNAFRE